MANKTSNYGLTKPLQTEFYDIDVHNANMDIIDTQLKNISNKFNGLSTDAGDLTGTLPIAHGGTGATTASGALTELGAAPSDHDHYYAGSSTVGGSATSAERLTDGKTIRTDLGKTSAAKFDGTENITVGVTGTLPVVNGGTGATTAEKARNNLGVITPDETVNLHTWKQYSVSKRASTSTANSVVSKIGSESAFPDVVYSEAIAIHNGEVTLVNPTTITAPTLDTIKVIEGKYAKPASGTVVFYYPQGVSFTSGLNYGTYYLQADQRSSLVVSFNKIVTSKENNTYPTNGEHTDGYWYEYQNQVGESDQGYTYGTTDLTAGTSALETGKLYFVYE